MTTAAEDFRAQVRRFREGRNRDPGAFTVSKQIYIAVDNDRAGAERRLQHWFGGRSSSADERLVATQALPEELVGLKRT